MIVLGIDGALHAAFSAAIARNGRIVAQQERAGTVALEEGLATIAAVLRQASVSGRDLDRLATGIGPGGFTGVRIAVTYAKSLAQAWSVPLSGVSSFDLLERGLALERCLTVVVGRPGVLSVRLRDGAAPVRRASGTVHDMVARFAKRGTVARPLAIVGAPEDVLAAFAEGGCIVKSFAPAMQPAAAAALIATDAPPPGDLHDVRPDYGELPAARVPAPR